MHVFTITLPTAGQLLFASTPAGDLSVQVAGYAQGRRAAGALSEIVYVDDLSVRFNNLASPTAPTVIPGPRDDGSYTWTLTAAIKVLGLLRITAQATRIETKFNRNGDIVDVIESQARFSVDVMVLHPAAHGDWDGLAADAGALAMHAALLSTGQVLYFGGNERRKEQHDAGPSGWDHTRMLTLANGHVDRLPSPGFDLFCSGHCLLGSGQLLVMGGTDSYPEEAGPIHGPHGHLLGVRDAARFEPLRAGLEDQLWHNRQIGTGNGTAWTDWGFFTTPANKAKQVSVVQHADGRLHAFMIGMDNEIWRNIQTGIDPDSSWSGWSYLSQAGDKAQSVVVVANHNARLHAFMIGMDDQIWHNGQTDIAAGSPWTGWHYLSQAGNRAKRLVVVPTQDGRLHAFMIGMDDQIWHNEQTDITAESPWTGWNYLSQAGDRAKDLLVVPNQGGRLHAFMIGMDNQIWHNDQTDITLGSPWTGWHYLSQAGDQAGSMVVTPNHDGRLHAFMIGMDNQIWHNDQTDITLGSPWTGWHHLSQAGDKAESLLVVPNGDGRLHAFMIGMDNQISHNDQTSITLGSPWTGWHYLSQAGDKAKHLLVVPNMDGRLHAFMIGMDNQVWHNDQHGTGLGSPWSGWNWLSSPGDTAKDLVVKSDGTGQLHAFAIGISRAPWIATASMLREPMPSPAPPELPRTLKPTGGGRWYPTPVTLADGRVLVMGGHPDRDDTRHSNFMVELFDPSQNQWSDAGDEPQSVMHAVAGTAEIYPRMHLLPDGTVFCVALLDERGHFWHPGEGFTSLPFSNPPSLHLSLDYNLNLWGSVLLPLRPNDAYKASILVAGGNAQPLLIEPRAANPSWQATGPRQGFPGAPPSRNFASLVLLPDGTVLMVGGTQDMSSDEHAVLDAEQYDPVSGQWTRLAPATVARQYHSAALLLPDGRVWTGGSNPNGGTMREERMEVFSPPYLFRGPRPTMDSSPTDLVWATSFTIGSQNPADIARVILMRCGSSTHGFDSDQRLVELEIQSRSEAEHSLVVTAPPNGNIAPPGHYMLFVLNARNVPSHARMVHL